ncbi:transporter substrate-binding domain-containing protein [Streptomyces sp. 3MP-14]|uniref:Transporter substrate-binding domain-containing protein n=1 Tax=Streptomyces mimosae TaxID=2586635 RepID=A0A5N6AH15_9ACTN|nr:MULTISPECIES: glutamate ABC transporter substrate-binding protein [Streptomyces]KAB8167971.1 transporter substrate-binding domain-containing protein [Streptomyces mimosae]KAB8177382.1 transporter substrate-binding domain-containing protein [Streptomyces sp. 3MP-14]
MRLRKASALAASVLALSLAATACGGGGDDDTISIGIKYDQPGLGLKTPDGEYVGFDVDVATFIAGELGYEPDQIDFVESPSGDRETMLDRGDVDFIVASYSITDERKEQVDFAGPYFVAHQDLLIRDGETVPNEEAINDLTLCSVGGSTSAANVQEEFAPDAELEELGTYSECLTGLENGTVDALTTDDSILAGYAAQEQNQGKFALAGLELSDEYYGVGVPKGETELRDDINAAITKMVDEGAWQDAVNEHFGPANYDAEPAPEITETD